MTPRPPGGGPSVGDARHDARVLSTTQPRLRVALARGCVVRVKGVSGTRVTLAARSGGRVAATGSAPVTGGAATVRLRFSVAARKRLHGRRSALRLVVSGTECAVRSSR